jgi:hypothetical protein
VWWIKTSDRDDFPATPANIKWLTANLDVHQIPIPGGSGPGLFKKLKDALIKHAPVHTYICMIYSVYITSLIISTFFFFGIITEMSVLVCSHQGLLPLTSLSLPYQYEHHPTRLVALFIF